MDHGQQGQAQGGDPEQDHGVAQHLGIGEYDGAGDQLAFRAGAVVQTVHRYVEPVGEQAQGGEGGYAHGAGGPYELVVPGTAQGEKPGQALQFILHPRDTSRH